MFLPALIAAALVFQGGAQQFDLVCQGTLTSSATNIAGSTKEVRNRIRIDLDRQAWCYDECAQVNSIVTAAPAEIVFSRGDTSSGRNLTRVDRVTGKFSSSIFLHMDGYDMFLDTTAQCRPEAYTAIPQAAF
ncbi:hypothetical protein [Brevundimonas sp.]|uniref:hypothetical protein n=1 Tax=Brevundimonas sp. TaxID=1871086 RepID=UPI0028A29852|nr:hypothetical protein [Brevundimonas sp.]